MTTPVALEQFSIRELTSTSGNKLASATLNGVGTLTAVVIIEEAVLAGVGTLTATGRIVKRGVSTLAGIGTLTATGSGALQVFENITLDDTLIHLGNLNTTVTHNLFIDDILVTSKPWYNIISEDVTVDDTVLPEAIANVLENINVLDIVLSGAALNVAIVDESELSDTLFCIYPKTIAEDINVSLLASAQLNMYNTLTDIQTIAGLLSSKAVFYTEATGFFTIDDSVLQIDAILEDLTINDTQTVLSRLYNLITENETITSVDASNISAYITSNALFTINDGNLSQHIGNLSVSDGLSFRVEIDFEDQEFSGWVMNPENYAVSNYSFNFLDSVFLEDKYLFSSPNGLYELNGTTDEGTAIQSRIKTAALDFNSENVKQIRQAILGTDGDTFVLIVSMDDDKTAYYELTAPSDGMSNKRIKVGKGLLGTRWQFELIHSDEEQFQLSSMELFPVIFKRKLK